MAEVLASQSIRTLFAGVSRQPTPIRRDSQVEEGINALFSVVTGGFEKRPATQYLSDLAGASTEVEYAVHSVDRDSLEQYIMLFADEDIRVYDAITGAAKTVTILDQDHYFLIDQINIDSTGIVQIAGADMSEEIAWDSTETEVVWNYELSDTSTVFKIEGSADGSTWNDLATGKTGASGSFTTTLDAVATDDHKFIRANITTAAGTDTDTLTLWGNFKSLSYLMDISPEDVSFTTVADFTFVVNRTAIPVMRELGGGTITGAVQEFADLPAASGSGNTQRVIGDDVDGFDGFYVRDNTVAGSNVWQESFDPTAANDIDQTWMPHQLVRQADGNWTFGKASWSSRGVGDEETVPTPSFINNAIQDLIFHRGRMALLSGETVTYSKVDAPLDFWPDKAFEVLDTDPIERSASGSSVSFLKWANSFRKTLFTTAVNAQFEVTAPNSLTPESAVMDLATTYEASPNAKPTTLGDVLYFASTNPRNSLVYEYFFDDASVSSTAVDVTRHVVDYIPLEIVQMAADPATGTLFALTSEEGNNLYIYRTFWDGTEKVQSSWSKWVFGDTEADAFIHGITVLSGFLVLVIERQDGTIYLEQVSLEAEAIDQTLGFIPLVDQRDIVTGVYDSGDDETTWTFNWGHDDDAIVVLGPNHDDPGRSLNLTYPSSTTAVATGDFSGEEAYVGRPYEMEVTLSELFLREGQDQPRYLGRLQLKHITLAYQDTGYIKAEVTPKDRAVKTKEFTARRISGSGNQINEAAIDDRGRFKFPINSRAESVDIKIKNDSIFPSVITGLTWFGHYVDRAEK